jgi:hypothetical protein
MMMMMMMMIMVMIMLFLAVLEDAAAGMAGADMGLS